MVRLQISPPALPFQRLLRRSLDAHIGFTPKSTGQYVEHKQGHLFILSDLFLICEWINPGEGLTEGKDMWLCYPPLAGKHLQVFPGQAGELFFVLLLTTDNTC